MLKLKYGKTWETESIQLCADTVCIFHIATKTAHTPKVKTEFQKKRKKRADSQRMRRHRKVYSCHRRAHEKKNRKKLYIWLIRSTMNNTKNNDLNMQCVWFGCLRTLDVTQHCNAMQCTIECSLKKRLRERMRLVAIFFHVCISTTTDNRRRRQRPSVIFYFQQLSGSMRFQNMTFCRRTSITS